PPDDTDTLDVVWSDVVQATAYSCDIRGKVRVLKRSQAELLRDIFGPLPFRQVHIDPAWLAWNNRSIVRLAKAASEPSEVPSGALDNARLAILADALEDAGCEEELILTHLREQGRVHIRGCHVIDLLLNKG